MHQFMETPEAKQAARQGSKTLVGASLVFLNQRVAEFSFSAPSAPPSTYAFKQNQERD
jgi:hypothetical protein